MMKRLVLFAIPCVILLTGCYAQYDVITDTGGTPEKSDKIWLWNSYYNFKENSTQKRINKQTKNWEYVGSYKVGKQNGSYYRIRYKQNYFHNLISVLSLGIVVPMQVELYPIEERPEENLEESAK